MLGVGRSQGDYRQWHEPRFCVRSSGWRASTMPPSGWAPRRPSSASAPRRPRAATSSRPPWPPARWRRPSASSRPQPRRAPPRIAIVGAGIAGLTAALTLQDKGIAATVYEASPRVGGRMHSDRSGYWDDGAGQRVLRRADRFRPHHDPRPRRALRPAGRRSPGRPAVGLDRHLLVPRRPLSRRAGRHWISRRCARRRRRISPPPATRPCGTSTSRRAGPSTT